MGGKTQNILIAWCHVENIYGNRWQHVTKPHKKEGTKLLILYWICLKVSWINLQIWSTDEWINKVFNTNFQGAAGDPRKLMYAVLCYWQWSCVYFMPLWTSSFRWHDPVWYHPSQIWCRDPTTQQPSAYCGINLCLPVNRIDLQVLSKQHSLPASDSETGSNDMTWTTSEALAVLKRGIAKGLQLQTRGKLTLRDKNLGFWRRITVLPIIRKYEMYNFPFTHNM